MSEKPFHSIWLTGNSTNIYKKIYLDGQELKGVRSCIFCYDVDEVPRVFLEIQTPDIEVEDFNIPVLISQTKGEEECQEEETSSKSGETDSGNCT